MRNRFINLWTLGGLSLPDLLRRTLRASWRDEVFGQGGRMAFYHFLALFPSLLVFFTVTAHIPHLGSYLRNALHDVTRQILPAQVAQMVQQTVNELIQHPRSGLRLISVCLAALWAAHNGTWAMIYGLNKAYEVEEKRSWRAMTVTNVALTFFLAATGFLALFFFFCSRYLQTRLHGGALPLRVLDWLVLTVAASVAFAVLYRFAPNLRDHEWRWSTPGALCALILWIGATVAARLYFDHVNNYAYSYGHLNGVVMLLIWLYVTNGAILIGGEMNSEIEKAAARQHRSIPRS
ncbi:MAG TPA: YihY/virulence factor BrkB family protein [Acidobacteriaceae bacterium]|jgi:membrane protein|nr:YihY/virulence factor BrkB family protein [Acidobacteriaceae bacterium]